eukprot:1891554-Ditylum_brightwellii.AAC.1
MQQKATKVYICMNGSYRANEWALQINTVNIEIQQGIFNPGQALQPEISLAKFTTKCSTNTLSNLP